jgi:hypothetical protein
VKGISAFGTRRVNVNPRLFLPRIKQLDRNATHVADIARNKSQAMDHRSSCNQGIDYGSLALAGPVTPEAGCGRINVENAVSEAYFEDFNPDGEAIGCVGAGSLSLLLAMPLRNSR